MRKDDGHVESYDKIPEEEKPPINDDLWSEPFHKGEIVDFKGVKMEIVRIKRLRKEIHLRFYNGPDEGTPEE